MWLSSIALIWRCLSDCKRINMIMVSFDARRTFLKKDGLRFRRTVVIVGKLDSKTSSAVHIYDSLSGVFKFLIRTKPLIDYPVSSCLRMPERLDAG